MIDANGMKLDDFGGGTVPQSYSPAQSLAAFWASIRGWFGGAKEADLVPLSVSLRESGVQLNQIPAPPAGQEWRSYYYAGSQRVATLAPARAAGAVQVCGFARAWRRTCTTCTPPLALRFAQGAARGSTSLTTNESGAVVSEIRYKAWGEVRYASGATPTDYKYTGQMETDTGLYYYVARFYDSLLGRFLSADSIIPGPWNPMAFDRYAYVFNSPAIYIDPSGHGIGSAIHDSFGDSKCVINGKCYTTPTLLDRKKLNTEVGATTGISASDLFDLYWDMWSSPDTNWNYIGGDDGFSIFDFLSAIIYNEASYNIEIVAAMTEAGVRWFYERAGIFGDDIYGKLDWFARYSGSAGLLANSHTFPDLTPLSPSDLKAFLKFGSSFDNPPNSWKEGLAYDRPYGWGNKSVLSVNAQELFMNNLQTMFAFLPGNDPFFVPSGCAYINWIDGTNYQASCPKVIR